MSEGSSIHAEKLHDFLVQIDEKLAEFDRQSRPLQLSDFPDGQLHIGYVQLWRIGPRPIEMDDIQMDDIQMVKYKYLKLFLERRNETSVERYFIAMERLLHRAINCYSGMPRIEPNKFLEMMVVDSCFIIELFRKHGRAWREVDDPIFSGGRYDLSVVVRDLLSPGNQLPFFVLVDFFNMIQDEPGDDLIDLALNFFGSMIGCTLNASNYIREKSSLNKIKHLVSLVYDCLCQPLEGKTEFMLLDNRAPGGIVTDLSHTYCATELQEAGVSFKTIMGKTLVDIDFEHGALRIPPLKFPENTLFLLDNLLEYENLFPSHHPRYVLAYVKFMQCLVNSTKDVEVLRQSGVIENWSGNDEMILKKISNMNSSPVPLGILPYLRVQFDVNEHCRRRRNVWMAKLWSNYFNSPWSLVSFIAAVVLLLLTLTQTVFAILSYHPS